MKTKLKYIVYVTVNLCNGKLYVGVHKTNPETFDGYIGNGIYRQQQATNDVPFHRAVRKYGYGNFRRTTIAVFDYTDDGWEQAHDLEQRIVTSTFLKSKNVYNVNLGGIGGFANQEKPVYQFDLRGKFMRKWNSIKEASREYDAIHISEVCQGRRNMCAGYYWSFDKKFKYDPVQVRKPVAQYTLSGKFIRVWESRKEVCRIFGFNNLHTIIGWKRPAGGYLWRDFTGNCSDLPPSEIMKMKKMGKLSLRNIGQYDLEGNLVKVWKDLADFKDSEFDQRYVYRATKGRQHTHKGYIFKVLQDKDIVLTSGEIQSGNNDVTGQD